MRKISKLILLCIILSFCSCGVFNKVSKQSSVNKKNVEISVEKEVETKVEDKSKIVIKEKADTTGYSKSKKLEAINDINRLEDIKNLTILTDQFIDIQQDYDTLSKKLKTRVLIKPQPVDLKFDRTTTINKDIKSNTIAKQGSTYKEKSKVKESVKDKKPVNILAYILGAIGIIAVGYFITKKYFKKAI